MLEFIKKRILLFAATATVVIFAISGSLLFQAATAEPPPRAGCYHVVDTAGKDWWLEDMPVFDLNTRAIQFDTGYSTGWIWPSSVEVTHRCVDLGE